MKISFLDLISLQFMCTPLGFMTKELRDLHRVDELKNFAANIFLKLVSKLRTGIRASIG